MKLIERGALLVAFPLFCQVVFVGILLFLLSRIESEIATESGSREFISAVHALTWHAAETIYMIHAESQTMQTNMSEPASTEATLGFRKDIDKITRLAAGHPRQMQQIPEIKGVAQDVEDKFETVREILRKPHHDRKKLARENQALLEASGKLVNSLASCMDIEGDFLRTSPEKSSQLRQSTRATLLGALLVNILLAVLFGVLYARGIQKPLMRVAENSKHLSAMEPLLPRLEGHDELANLDQLLHRVADDVAASLAKEKGMIENAGDMICSLDPDGTIKLTNPYSTRLLGYSKEELLGKNIMELIEPDDCLVCDQELKACREASEMRVFELRLHAKSSEAMHTRWSVIWSELQASLFCVVHDITKQKEVERIKQDFVNMISHDLRSPLTSVLGSMSLILEGAKGDVSAEVEREVKDANRGIELLMSFVNDLLDFQKLNEGKFQLEMEVVNVDELLVDATDLVKTLAENNGVNLAVNNHTNTVYADRQRLLQTAVNLLGNAIKFSPRGSTVAVNVETVEGFWQLSVCDQGPGIDEEYREKIFQPFEQAPSSKPKEGSGLGLAICKVVVDAHKGEIGVEPALNNQGSRFWIRLPQA